MSCCCSPIPTIPRLTRINKKYGAGTPVLQHCEHTHTIQSIPCMPQVNNLASPITLSGAGTIHIILASVLPLLLIVTATSCSVLVMCAAGCPTELAECH